MYFNDSGILSLKEQWILNVMRMFSSFSDTNGLKNIGIKLSCFAFIHAQIPVMEYVYIKMIGIISVSIYPAPNILLFVSS